MSSSHYQELTNQTGETPFGSPSWAPQEAKLSLPLSLTHTNTHHKHTNTYTHTPQTHTHTLTHTTHTHKHLHIASAVQTVLVYSAVLADTVLHGDLQHLHPLPLTPTQIVREPRRERV